MYITSFSMDFTLLHIPILNEYVDATVCSGGSYIYAGNLNASIPLVGGAVALTGGVVIFTSYGGQPSRQPTACVAWSHRYGISSHVSN